MIGKASSSPYLSSTPPASPRGAHAVRSRISPLDPPSPTVGVVSGPSGDPRMEWSNKRKWDYFIDTMRTLLVFLLVLWKCILFFKDRNSWISLYPGQKPLPLFLPSNYVLSTPLSIDPYVEDMLSGIYQVVAHLLPALLFIWLGWIAGFIYLRKQNKPDGSWDEQIWRWLTKPLRQELAVFLVVYFSHVTILHFICDIWADEEDREGAIDIGMKLAEMAEGERRVTVDIFSGARLGWIYLHLFASGPFLYAMLCGSFFWLIHLPLFSSMAKASRINLLRPPDPKLFFAKYIGGIVIPALLLAAMTYTFQSMIISLGIFFIYLAPAILAFIPPSLPLLSAISQEDELPTRVAKANTSSNKRCKRASINVQTLSIFYVCLGFWMVAWAMDDQYVEDISKFSTKATDITASAVKHFLMPQYFLSFLNHSRYFMVGFLWIYFDRRGQQTNRVKFLATCLPWLALIFFQPMIPPASEFIILDGGFATYASRQARIWSIIACDYFAIVIAYLIKNFGNNPFKGKFSKLFRDSAFIVFFIHSFIEHLIALSIKKSEWMTTLSVGAKLCWLLGGTILLSYTVAALLLQIKPLRKLLHWMSKEKVHKSDDSNPNSLSPTRTTTKPKTTAVQVKKIEDTKKQTAKKRQVKIIV